VISEIVLATSNRHKVAEITAMLADVGIKVYSLDDFPGAPDVVEDGTSYEENALKKARSAAVFTGKPAVADDTGLEVQALDGRPGLYSARFAGDGCTFQDNIRKLLALLKDVPMSQRNARFISVLALVTPDGTQELFKGQLDGYISEATSGSVGFGYDPVFWLPEVQKTLAQLSPDQKNEVSHRRRAVDQLKARLTGETIGA
jgi:XTP/dITP diphosphohydrolase